MPLEKLTSKKKGPKMKIRVVSSKEEIETLDENEELFTSHSGHPIRIFFPL